VHSTFERKGLRVVNMRGVKHEWFAVDKLSFDDIPVRANHMNTGPGAKLTKGIKLGDAYISSRRQVRGGCFRKIEDRDTICGQAIEIGQRRDVCTMETWMDGFVVF